MGEIAGSTPGPDADDVLIVPPGLQVAPSTITRLRHALATAGPDVVGVVATTADLPSGSSDVTAAEHAALAEPATPTGSAPRIAAAEVEGVALLRRALPHDLLDHRIRFAGDGGTAPTLVVDPGAVAIAREPRRDLDHADPAGVPPFRWRPVVVFLAGDPDPARAEVAHRLVDELVGLDVEARLAVHTAPPGPHRTQPCLPSEATIRVLVPDLVVALDAAAIDHAERWSAGHRHTIVVELDGDDDRVELIGWTIGHAAGRRRARIGGRVPPTVLAALVNRLCAGPQPGPPRVPGAEPDGPDATTVTATAVTLAAGAARPPTVPAGRRVLVHLAGPTPGALLSGLVDHLDAAGHEVVLLAPGSPVPPASTDDVVLAARGAPPGGDAARHGGPAPVVVVDLEPEGGPTHPSGVATTAAGIVVAGSLDGDGPRIRLPILPTRARARALTVAGARRVRPAQPVLGWTAGGPGPSAAPSIDDAVIRAVALLLSQHPDLHLDVVAATDEIRSAFVETRRVVLRTTPPDPDALATWSAQIWTPHPDHLVATGDDRPLADAALAGVPTVLALTDARHLGGLADRELAVARPELPADWAARLDAVLDDAQPARPARRARARADALLDGDAPARTVVRLLGWYDAVSAR